MELFKLLGTIAIDNSEANEEIDNTTEKAEKSEGKMSAAFAKIGTAVATAFSIAAIASFGKACVELSDGMANAANSFAASTGIATESMGEYEDALESIYRKNYGESFEDIAVAMASVKQQMGDLGADALEEMTTDAIILRDTFEYEVNESTRAAKMLMDQFGYSSKEAFNLIAQGAQGGLDKNGDLLDSINEYSVHFKQLGLDGEEMFNMLANGSAAGTFSVDKLGDAIKEFGIRVKDGSDTSAAAFEYLGYDAEKLFQTFNEGGEDAAAMTQILIDELASMPDSVEKTTAGVALFGTMWEDLGAEGIKAMSELDGQISTTKDTLASIDEVKYDSLGSALEGLKRKFETSVLIPIGDLLIPVVQGAIDIIDSFASNIDLSAEGISGFASKLSGMFSPEFLENIQRAVDRIAMFGQRLGETAIETFSGKLAGLQEMFTTLATVVQPLVEAMITTLMQRVENAILTVETIVIPIISGLIDAFIRIGTTIGTAIAPAVAEISAKWTEMCALLSDYYTEWILPTIEAFIDMIGELWAENQDKIQAIGALFSAVFALISTLFTWFYENVIQGLLLPAIEFVTNFVFENMETIKSIFQSAFDIIGGIIDFFVALFTGNWQGMWTAVISIVTSSVELVKSWFTLLQTFLSTIMNAIWSKITEIWENIKLSISLKIESIVDGMKTKFTEAKEAVTEVFTNMKDTVADIFEGMWNAIKGKINSILGGMESMVNGVVSGINVLLDGVEEVANAAGELLGFDPISIKLSSVSLPRLAKGTVVTKPTIAEIGEDGAEAVVPLENNTQWIRRVSEEMKIQGISSDNTELIGLMNVIIELLKTMIMDNSTLPETLLDAIASLRFDINNREFARLVKAVN